MGIGIIISLILIKEIMFKAGLDLVLPAELNEIQEAVNEINTASRF